MMAVFERKHLVQTVYYQVLPSQNVPTKPALAKATGLLMLTVVQVLGFLLGGSLAVVFKPLWRPTPI